MPQLSLRHSALLFATLLLVAGLFTACTFPVFFNSHSPYKTSFKRKGPMVLLVSDRMETSYVTTASGPFYNRRKFNVHFGQALIAQVRARFETVVEGVYVVKDSQYAALHDVVPLGLEILEATPSPYTPITPEELRTFVDLAPSVYTEETGLLMIIRRLKVDINGNQPVYFMDIEVVDRAKGELVFAGNFRGTGPRFFDSSTMKTNVENLQQSFAAMFSQAFYNVQQELFKSLEEKSK